MKKREKIIIAACLVAFFYPLNACAFDANRECPFHERFLAFDLSFHSCSNGHVDGFCTTFVEGFRQLIPKYDCAREYDTAPVPAIWLAEGGALEDYIRLLYRLSFREELQFQDDWFDQASMEAKQLFASEEFRSILDGHYAEEYLELSKKTESKLNEKQ